MKYKKFLIALLLVSFCGGEETQAEICDWYVSQVDSIHKYQYKPLVVKYNRVSEMYLNDELSQALANGDFSRDFPNTITEIVSDLEQLEPNQDNIQNHNKMIEYILKWEEGLTILTEWVETKNVDTFNEGALLIEQANFNFNKYWTSLTCPAE